MGALDGITVLDLSRLLPGPFCTTLLADHGAEVVAVEAPRFRDSPVLGEVPMVRRNKRHIALDLSGDAGKRIFFQLAERADAILEGFRPGVTDRLGVGYETVRERNPRVVYCSLTGYGQDGPLAARAGHDLNYMALAGMLDLMRDSNGKPVMPGFQMADLAGGLYAALAILMALISRDKTGEGQYIDVSMTDSLVSLLPVPISFSSSGDLMPGRIDNTNDDWFACYGIYAASDGEYLSVGPLEPHLWEVLCRKLGCEEYIPLQYVAERNREIRRRFDEIFATKTLDEWLNLLNEPNDCVAPVTRVKDIEKDAHFQSRTMLVRTNDGPPQPGVAPKMFGTPGDIRRPPYSFGEHGAEILGELGYSDDDVSGLARDGVVWLPDR